MSLAPLATPGRLRLVSYNIHKGTRGFGPLRRQELPGLAAALASLDADLIALQEVRGAPRHEPPAVPPRFAASRLAGGPSHHPSQAELLAPPGLLAAYHRNARTRQGEHGNALLSRWAPAEAWHRDLSAHRFEQRGLLHLSLMPPGGRLQVVVVHLGLHHAGRRRQAERLIAHLDEVVPEGPLLVAGDFNDWAEKLDPVLAEAGLRRAAPGGRRPATFPSRVPVFALDRVYARGLEALAVHAPRGGGWPRLSDHLPLVADFAWPPAPAA